MSSPNLAVPHVAAAQNQKEVTINDAIDVLDNSINRTLSLEMTDADITLTSQQLRVKYPGSGAEVVIAAGEAVLVQGNGDDLYAIGTSSVV